MLLTFYMFHKMAEKKSVKKLLNMISPEDG